MLTDQNEDDKKFHQHRLYRNAQCLDVDIWVMWDATTDEDYQGGVELDVLYVNQRNRELIYNLYEPERVFIKKDDYDKWTPVAK